MLWAASILNSFKKKTTDVNGSIKEQQKYMPVPVQARVLKSITGNKLVGLKNWVVISFYCKQPLLEVYAVSDWFFVIDDSKLWWDVYRSVAVTSFSLFYR